MVDQTKLANQVSDQLQVEIDVTKRELVDFQERESGILDDWGKEQCGTKDLEIELKRSIDQLYKQNETITQ